MGVTMVQKFWVIRGTRASCRPSWEGGETRVSVILRKTSEFFRRGPSCRVGWSRGYHSLVFSQIQFARKNPRTHYKRSEIRFSPDFSSQLLYRSRGRKSERSPEPYWWACRQGSITFLYVRTPVRVFRNYHPHLIQMGSLFLT